MLDEGLAELCCAALSDKVKNRLDHTTVVEWNALTVVAMDYVPLLYISPFILGGLFIVWQILLDRLLSKAVAKVTDEEFSRLLTELKLVGTGASKSFFLKKKQSEISANSFQVILPSEMDVEWLQDANLRIELLTDPLSEEYLGEVSLIRETNVRTDFELIPIPRISFKNGGGANQYTSKVWFKRNPSFLQLAKEIYPRDPDGFVTRLFYGAGRVNSPFEWLQSPPKFRCQNCSRKLQPVLEVYGESIGLNPELTYYIAACPVEVGEFQIFVQFT